MISSQSLITASAAPVMPLRRAMPALLTRMETGPMVSAICFAIAAQAARSVTSSAKLSTVPPASLTSLAVSAGACRVDIERDHPRALAGIADRDRAADAGAGAGDDCDVVLEAGAWQWFPLFRRL